MTAGEWDELNADKSRVWATWSVVLSVVALMVNGAILWQRYWYWWDGPHWLPLAVFGPTLGGFLLGAAALFPCRRVRIAVVAAIGCSIALTSAVVAAKRGTWKCWGRSCGRACIANMRNVDSALQQAMIDEPEVASMLTNSAESSSAG